ncbi:MAG: hypothetical protein IT162_03660 [Bryobacterales bacterium]|nr:hypothetical protein [Bryobacterales bacterium]
MMVALGIFAVVLSAAVTFVAAELAARLYVRRAGSFVRARWRRIRTKVDLQSLPMLEPQVRWDINEEGERGDPLPAGRDGLYRVLALGGSAVECALLDQDSAWPAVLQKQLNEPESLAALGARRVHVGNLGKSLLPVAGVKAMLQETLPRYDKLDLAVLMVGASDATDWLELGTPATLPDKPYPHALAFEEPAAVKFSWSPGGLALRRATSVWQRRFTNKVHERKHGGSRFVALRERRRNARHWIANLPDPEPMLSKLETDLRETIALLQAKGTRVIVAQQVWIDRPLTAEEDAMMWNFCRGRMSFEQPQDTYYTYDAVRALFGKVDRRVARVAANLGVERVELMRQVSLGLDTLYDAQHFTPEGARQVARATAETVLAGVAVPAAAPEPHRHPVAA